MQPSIDLIQTDDESGCAWSANCVTASMAPLSPHKEAIDIAFLTSRVVQATNAVQTLQRPIVNGRLTAVVFSANAGIKIALESA